MGLLEFVAARSPIHGVDPRARLLVALPLVLLLAIAQDLWMLGGAIVLALGLAVGLRIPAHLVGRRLLWLNGFLIVVWLTVLTTPAAQRAAAITLVAAATLKANAILLLLTSLVSTIEAVALGHALAHLHVPRKLVHLFLFTVRYTEVLHLEYLRLARAMRARAFHPRLDRRTYRALALLVGMLLVRSLDRADRVLAAMKCRGFRGEFHLLHHFHFRRRDAWFGLAGALAVLMLAAWEWT